jgi:hypothetical protein
MMCGTALLAGGGTLPEVPSAAAFEPVTVTLAAVQLGLSLYNLLFERAAGPDIASLLDRQTELLERLSIQLQEVSSGIEILIGALGRVEDLLLKLPADVVAAQYEAKFDEGRCSYIKLLELDATRGRTGGVVQPLAQRFRDEVAQPVWTTSVGLMHQAETRVLLVPIVVACIALEVLAMRQAGYEVQEAIATFRQYRDWLTERALNQLPQLLAQSKAERDRLLAEYEKNESYQCLFSNWVDTSIEPTQQLLQTTWTVDGDDVPIVRPPFSEDAMEKVTLKLVAGRIFSAQSRPFDTALRPLTKSRPPPAQYVSRSGPMDLPPDFRKSLGELPPCKDERTTFRDARGKAASRLKDAEFDYLRLGIANAAALWGLAFLDANKPQPSQKS